MDELELVNGNKKILIGEYRLMYPIHGRRWRKLLKEKNPWHSSDTGLRAWQNIGKGTTGNEALRLIISDMKSILSKTSKNDSLKRHRLKRNPSTSQPQ